MNESSQNRRWVLRKRPEADISADNLEMVTEPVPKPAECEVLVRNLYLSLDPTHRLWVSDREQYLLPVQVGDVMRGGTLGVVVESSSDAFQAGDIVKAAVGSWESYSVMAAKMARPVKPGPELPLSIYTSVLVPPTSGCRTLAACNRGKPSW